MRRILVHLGAVAAIAALLVLAIAYPFLAGRYDALAVPLSTMAQVFGVVGLPLVPIGVLWLAMPRFGVALGIAAVAVGTFVALVLALFATLSVGNAFGVITLAAWAASLVSLIPGVRRARRGPGDPVHAAPIYLVLLPAASLVAQLALAGPLTTSSRARAVASAGQLIEEIEAHRAAHGRYPASMQAQHRDFHSQVVGVEGYEYAASGDGYDLSFEQPRFLLDRFGTREWVVYNPGGEHRSFSHAARRLGGPEAQERSQGWYASGDAGFPGWRYFLFD
jgi:hypothetical protein